MSAAGTTNPWPTELRLHKDRKTLTVAFDDGERFDLAAEYLRVRSPSAEVQGHSPSERRTVAGKQEVQILELHPVGNYAVRIVFDDMHSTGIFSWDYLHRARPQSRRLLGRLSWRACGAEPVARAGAVKREKRRHFYGCFADNRLAPLKGALDPNP